MSEGEADKLSALGKSEESREAGCRERRTLPDEPVGAVFEAQRAPEVGPSIQTNGNQYGAALIEGET